MAQPLISGGAGFIGSHTCLLLQQTGHDLVVIENFSNSNPIDLDRVGTLAGVGSAGRLSLFQVEIRNRSQLEQAFASAPSPIDAVIHFAGLKAEEDSVQNPLRY